MECEGLDNFMNNIPIKNHIKIQNNTQIKRESITKIMLLKIIIVSNSYMKLYVNYHWKLFQLKILL